MIVLSCQYLEEEFRKGAQEDDPMPPVQPYHYGSHYSNSGTVLHFLVRMPPFTKMFLAYQGKIHWINLSFQRSKLVNEKEMQSVCWMLLRFISMVP